MNNTVFEPLLNNKAARTIFDRFEQIGYEIRFVGGAVRDCLAHRPVSDIDLATPMTPESVMSKLEEIGIQVIPTGIDHGTVTAIVEGQSFEITTLRKDVSTDGRRAVVSYTHDWYEDALRRDFTFNAMSLRADGSLFDPFEGKKDLQEGRVVFIGDPVKRIQEDVLRILRFFRFHAWYGKGKPDRAGLMACIEQRGLLDQLSPERVRQELYKLLRSSQAAKIWKIMVDDAVLAQILPHAYDVNTLTQVIELESKARLSDPLRRLLSLYKRENIVLSDLSERMCLTKVEKARTALYKKQVVPDDMSFTDEEAWGAYLYHYGRAVLLDGLIINHARLKYYAVTDNTHAEAIRKIQQWQRVFLPLSGDDLKEHFRMQEGPELGQVLKDAEQYWIEKKFQPTKEELLVWTRDKYFSTQG